MSKIPYYMAELKERNMENSTFLCKFICVQPFTHAYFVRFYSLCTIFQSFCHSFLIHLSYFNLSYDE